MVNSKLKGNRLERYFAKVFTSLGWPASRTQQFQGIGSDGDITLEHVPEVHIEAKGREQLAIYKWIDQAVRDSRGKRLPVVVCKGDRREPLLLVQLERLPEFLTLMMEARCEVPETEESQADDDRGSDT